MMLFHGFLQSRTAYFFTRFGTLIHAVPFSLPDDVISLLT
jgi:hypothetical protein